MRRTLKWQRKKKRPLHHGQTTVGRRGPAAPTRSPQAQSVERARQECRASLGRSFLIFFLIQNSKFNISLPLRVPLRPLRLRGKSFPNESALRGRIALPVRRGKTSRFKIQDEEVASPFKIQHSKFKIPPLRPAPESRQRIERDIENVSVLTQIQERASQQLSGMIFFIIDTQALALGVEPRLGLERQNVALLG